MTQSSALQHAKRVSSVVAASQAMAALPYVVPIFDSADDPSAESLEREDIVRMLRRHHWRVKETALALGMSRATIYRKMSRYKIVYPGPA